MSIVYFIINFYEDLLIYYPNIVFGVLICILTALFYSIYRIVIVLFFIFRHIVATRRSHNPHLYKTMSKKYYCVYLAVKSIFLSIARYIDLAILAIQKELFIDE